jgi:hypothetical protein
MLQRQHATPLPHASGVCDVYINQSVHQSIHTSINHQSINQSIHPSIHQSTNQSINQSTISIHQTNFSQSAQVAPVARCTIALPMLVNDMMLHSITLCLSYHTCDSYCST